MNLADIRNCPGTLAEGFMTYSPACLRRLFEGKKVSHILPYDKAQSNEQDAALFLENRKRISISGVQEKLSMTLENNRLRLTRPGEAGRYILKPIPRDVKKTDMVPANEHLTMQIARQVYRITTAENALVFFPEGTPAYLTKRFDVKPDDSRRGKEDFATLAGKTSDNAGPDFKYQTSYEEAGLLLRRFVSAWKIEVEKYFSLVVFNYLYSNGDAHLKNFSLLEADTGDYLLSPAYDLLNTHLHVDDTDFALEKGLFTDGYKSPAWRKNGHPGKADFIELGKRIGVADKRIEKLLQPFLVKHALAEAFILRSFLDESTKRAYLIQYNTRRNYLAD